MAVGEVIKHLVYKDGCALVILWQSGGWDDGFVPVESHELSQYPLGTVVDVTVSRRREP